MGEGKDILTQPRRGEGARGRRAKEQRLGGVQGRGCRGMLRREDFVEILVDGRVVIDNKDASFKRLHFPGHCDGRRAGPAKAG